MKHLLVSIIALLASTTVHAANWTIDDTHALNDTFKQVVGVQVAQDISINSMVAYHVGDTLTIQHSYQTDFESLDRNVTHENLLPVVDEFCGQGRNIMKSYRNLKQVQAVYEYHLNTGKYEKFSFTCR
ncbi:hypothetical protein [Vibrio owensii]|uniref:hypothetical protein n=1 Tax=Vibrio owensii TaxID=696485 RepID=UPI0018F21661|nr:hypothetical protein [Vibrio owensii]